MTSDPDGPGRPGRGGRRPGAGAPRGNLNALRSGRHVADLALRAALELVPPEARPAIFAALKASGTIKAGLIVPPPANVTPIWPGARPYTSSPPPPAEQSNVGPYGELIHRLDAYRFRGAADFVRRHHRYTAALGDVLDYLDDLIESEYEKLINPAALIRADVHKTIGIPRGDVLVCPACRWSGLNITQEETGT